MVGITSPSCGCCECSRCGTLRFEDDFEGDAEPGWAVQRCTTEEADFLLSGGKLRTDGGAAGAHYRNSIEWVDTWQCVSVRSIVEWENIEVTAGIHLHADAGDSPAGVRFFARPNAEALFTPGWGYGANILGDSDGCQSLQYWTFPSGEYIPAEKTSADMEIRLNWIRTDEEDESIKLWQVCLMVDGVVVSKTEWWLILEGTLEFGVNCTQTELEAGGPRVNWDNFELRAN